MADQYETVYCIHCKAPIHPQAEVCPRCRGSQRPGSPPPPGLVRPGAPAPPVRRKRWEKDRPTGVTVIAVIIIIHGLASIAVACALFALIGLMGAASQDPQASEALGRAFGDVESASLVLRVTALIMLPIGVLDFVVAIGLLYVRPWARILGIVLGFIGAIMNVVGIVTEGAGVFNVVFLIVNAVIALYLLTLRPEFSDYYG